ncbi:MAG: tRNA (adenosine(37)-N6)-threonylcarbamoyltransferase complex ATPase subunit type 1 TsaE [Treponema sp.]|nr:tRNA (adenosine(37)-N6)-threonylcarbamoyltransferase complex ATPase subunit type 1 TsaE [Treponema sp.]
MLEITSNSPDETTALGKRIAGYLSNGSVVALEGRLGSGKTCLVKGITSGLGITENITSPTYTIINEYTRNNLSPIYHIDVYRLSGDKDFEDIGGLEIINSDGISLIEWSERIQKSLPSDTITVSLFITESSSRLIKINGLESI